MTYRNIRYAVEDGVALLTLARDDRRNTLSELDMVEEMVDAIGRAGQDPEVRVLVLTGEGVAFSSGGNLKDLKTRNDAHNSAELRDWYKGGVQRIPLALEAFDRPVIGAINGPAYGAGLDLACYCDIAIGSTEARFCEQFVNLNVIPGDGGAWILPRKLGWAAAADLLFTGRVVDAAEAKRLGILYEVVAPEELMAHSMALARRIASRPPRALRLIKMLMRQGTRQSLPDHLDHCAALQGLLQKTEDHAAALDGWLAKTGDPAFTGR